MAAHPAHILLHKASKRDSLRILPMQSRGDTETEFPLNEQRHALLAEIDNARFSWFHIKIAFVSGAGFFTDAYDIFAINIVAGILGYLYGSVQSESDPGLTGRSLSIIQALGIKVATPVGILIGQLIFGWLGDVLGRKRIYGVELIVIMVATFGQTVSAPGLGINVVGVLIAWRTFLGIGIGGDYPLSAIISSEFSSVYIRGRVMTAVFANQGWGQLAATLVSYIVVLSYKSSILNDPAALGRDLDQIWRIIIGLGCIPAVIALYFRLTIPETPRFTMDVARNVQQAAIDVESFLTTGAYTVDPDAASRRTNICRNATPDFGSYFCKWKNLKVLLGTSYSWFALDIAFYGLGLNSSIILNAIGFGSPSSSLTGTDALYENLKNTCIGNLILSVAGFVPGYWVSFLFIDRWGRKPIQLMGFAVLTALFVVMGFAYNTLIATAHGKVAFVALYCLANFFQNFGPNTTTFIIPGEAFPTRYRSTAHGISAASGKLGAVVAQVAFQWLKDIGGPNAFLDHILEIFAVFMLTGVFSTLLIPETNQRTLEALSGDTKESFIMVEQDRSYAIDFHGRRRPSATKRSPQSDMFLMEPITAPTKRHTKDSPVLSPGSSHDDRIWERGYPSPLTSEFSAMS